MIMIIIMIMCVLDVSYETWSVGHIRLPINV